MAWYRIAENVLDAIANAINAKTGGSSPMTPVEMVLEIQSISGGEEAFFTTAGVMYYSEMDIPLSASPAFQAYKGASELVEARIFGGAITLTGSIQSLFQGCSKLKTLTVENIYNYGNDFAGNCPLLENVTLGKIGIPVTALAALTFRGNTQSNLSITIFVADDAVIPFSTSPFGATNATIIYRSATTGEVITV